MNSEELNNEDSCSHCFGKRIWEEIRWIARVIYSAADRFYWDDGFSKAASLAYTSLVSLVPFVALIFGIFAFFALSEEYVATVEQFIITKFVPAENVAEQLGDFLTNVRNNVSVFGLPMLAFFIVSSILLINSVEYALNETWQVFEARSWSHRIGAFSTIILVTPIMLLAVYVFTTLRLDSILETIGAEALHPVLHPLYNYAIPVLMLMVAFGFLYYMVPKAAVKFKSVIFGSIFSSVVFVCAYSCFAFYIERNASYEKLYGAISAIPIFLFWLYIVWAIVLLGAEVTYQAQYLPHRGKAWKRTVYSMGDGQVVLAVQALVVICKAFLDGTQIPDDIELAEKLGCSSTVLRPTLAKLAKADLITPIGRDEKQFTLLKAPDKIYLKDIKSVLFSERKNLRFSAEM